MHPSVFQDALTAVSQGVLICGPNRRILYSNPAFTSITGYSAEELVGRTCRFMQGPGTDPQTVAAMNTALLSGHDFAGEILNYRKGGEPFWNDLAITPVIGAGGGPGYYVGITRDLTARKAAEANLAALEERYRFLLDHALAGIVMHDASTAIQYISARAASLLGMTREEALGVRADDSRWAFLQEDGSRLPIEQYPVNLALAGTVVESMVLGKPRTGNQEPIWLMCNAYPAIDDRDQPGRIVITFTDVTDLKKSERAFNASEERLRLILRGANDASWDWNMATGELYLSPRWWQMLGYEPKPPGGLGSFTLGLVHPRDRTRVRDTIDRAFNDGSESYQFEFRLKHHDGRYMPLLTRGYILRNAAGEVLRVSGTTTDLTDRKASEKLIYRLAFYDSLTGLPNRTMLVRLMRTAMEVSAKSQQHGALLFIDLDNFKMLNDTRGHDVGDMLLQQVARRLRRCVGRAGIVARLGGDEFLVLLPNLALHDHAAGTIATALARRVQEEICRPYKLGRRDYRCTLSIGVATFNGSATGAEGIFKHADLAMYEAKAAGRNTMRLFTESMQAAVDERLALETDFRHGLQAGQMVLYAQPQVDRTGTPVGAEVLVRWRHPRRGLVPPGAFIPMAEATGLILPLGQWVLDAACKALASWALSPRLAALSLSVNVSVRQFHEADFADGVLAVLAETGANPARLKLEMTETIFAEKLDEIVAKLDRLREQGIRFSIDDFGTGYASLRYLQRMPLDELKIDGSFVRDVLTNPNDAAIARIIISLTDNLGVSVVAEGVETDSQYRFLIEQGCEKFQGYLFGRPMPLPEFQASIESVDVV
jgi:diguanylate cyclase (GGDEF)-like protein/PAS domain S-box-containing protein